MIVFKPMRGLTIATLICLGILLWLGTWQYQRFQWKTALLKDIETASLAKPLTNIRDIDALIEAKTPFDFRRVSLEGVYEKSRINKGQPFYFLRPEGKNMSWRIYQPFSQEGRQVYAATQRFFRGDKAARPASFYGTGKAIGYIRRTHKKHWFSLKSTPSKNRWTVFNGEPDILDWSGKQAGQNIETSYYIDVVLGAKNASALPAKKPDMPNNHLDYMLTWYSFAIILLIIYFILHNKQGRLYRKKN
ncbi:MAG: SURF1 family protein [Robiginitomaculum sp.]